MGVRNPGRDELLRLEEKTLDAQFLTTIQQGLNCSPFESRSVLEVVKEVYFPFLAQAQTSALLPGKITLVGVCADEPAGKPIAKCAKRTVCLLLHRGAGNDPGPPAATADRLRRHGAITNRQFVIAPWRRRRSAVAAGGPGSFPPGAHPRSLSRSLESGGIADTRRSGLPRLLPRSTHYLA